eukprot:gnl/MRDRNA2_/MRDRNA2_100045_c0_seq1.p1 gnl/MRDRNA2_/MRDRNA2_100045_c0~~gnl/MRDRNA2_/MRDRNA2_100045_c0_seq1.p1  ORF type:complete len:761 (-),score=195.17 gnl/MRDRNA2_/MRDRNA2_100045_c0_seq1:27-2234(-)
MPEEKAENKIEAAAQNAAEETKKVAGKVEKDVENALEKEEEKPLEAFSQWRCLWDCKAAQDPKRCEPYAYLEITIDKAKGLAAADINGLSDPFVQICVNDEQLEGMKTKTIPSTLAPVWDETFKVPVYQPLSIVTLSVYDADFGTSLGALDFLGLDDDFIGFVDLQINKFPFNREIEGWFDLGTEEDFEDSIKKRMDAEEAPFGGGQIHLKMKLIVHEVKDEFFALTLPQPSQGHGYPPLSLPNVYKNAIELTELSDAFGKKVGLFVEQLKEHLSGLWVFSLFFIWHPNMILPVLAIAFAAHTTWHNRPVFKKAFRKLTQKKEKTDVKKLFKKDVHAVMAANRMDHLQKERQEELQKKLLEDDLENGEPVERDARGHIKTKEEKDAEEMVAQLGSTLETVQKFIPAEQQMLLRGTEGSLNSAIAAIHQLEDLSQGVNPEQAVVVTGAMIGGSCLLFVLRDWQFLAMQIGLTIGVCAAFWQVSALGRLAFAVNAYRKEPEKVKIAPETHEQQANGVPPKLENGVVEKPKVIPGGDPPPQVPPETANMPDEDKEMLAAAAERARKRAEERKDNSKTAPGLSLAELDASPSAKLPNGDSSVAHSTPLHRSMTPHRLSVGQAATLTLTGSKGGITTPRTSDHQYEAFTFTQPAWCQDCGGFLWGASGQGFRCKLCNRDVCVKCSKDAEGTCPGKVRVRKKPDAPPKSSTFQCCSRYMPSPADKKEDPVPSPKAFPPPKK